MSKLNRRGMAWALAIAIVIATGSQAHAGCPGDYCAAPCQIRVTNSVDCWSITCSPSPNVHCTGTEIKVYAMHTYCYECGVRYIQYCGYTTSQTSGCCGTCYPDA